MSVSRTDVIQRVESGEITAEQGRLMIDQIQEASRRKMEVIQSIESREITPEQGQAMIDRINKDTKPRKKVRGTKAAEVIIEIAAEIVSAVVS